MGCIYALLSRCSGAQPPDVALHGMSGEDQLRRRVWSSPCAHNSTFVLG